jgi:hypothetical protein
MFGQYLPNEDGYHFRPPPGKEEMYSQRNLGTNYKYLSTYIILPPTKAGLIAVSMKAEPMSMFGSDFKSGPKQTRYIKFT